MSGIAAVFTRTAQAASPVMLADMLGAMTSRGPDGRTMYQSGPVALGHLSFLTTPEAMLDVQPCHHRQSGSVLVMDGRLDNRGDLIERLDGAVSARDGDAAIMSAAWDRWGDDTPQHLVGDFAVVIWDQRRQRLTCARDVMGVRPVCYAQTRDGQFVVASELRGLLASGGVSDEQNEGRALEHLVDLAQSRSETLYRAVHRLPPAHLIHVTRDDMRITEYWRMRAPRAIRYTRRAEYADHARELIARAVRAQSRNRSGLGVLLSGGVDSSAIAGAAAEARIAVTNYTVSFAGHPADERRYAERVATKNGQPLRVVPYRPTGSEWYVSQAAAYRDLPDYPNGRMLDAARTLAASEGATVLLTGVGGDEWFTGSPYRYADWISAWRLWRVARELGADVAARGWRGPMRELALCGVWPLLPHPARRLIKATRCRRTGWPDWLNPAAAARTDLRTRVATGLRRVSGDTFALADRRSIAGGGFQVHSDEMEDRAASRNGVEHRHPLYDRRIIEFALGVPEDEHWREGRGKGLLRSAAGRWLPDAVAQRRDKAEFSVTYADALGGVAPPALPRLLSRGWVTAEVVDEIRLHLQEWRAAGDTRYWSLLGSFWMLFALECWLEAATRSADDRFHENPGTARDIVSVG